jgi:hypothetical protein
MPNQSAAANRRSAGQSMVRVNSSATVQSPVVSGGRSMNLFVRRFDLETTDKKTTT